MESVNDMRIKNGLMLLLTAFIWGTAFVAQSVGMDYLEPFTFNGVGRIGLWCVTVCGKQSSADRY